MTEQNTKQTAPQWAIDAANEIHAIEGAGIGYKTNLAAIIYRHAPKGNAQMVSEGLTDIIAEKDARIAELETENARLRPTLEALATAAGELLINIDQNGVRNIVDDDGPDEPLNILRNEHAASMDLIGDLQVERHLTT